MYPRIKNTAHVVVYAFQCSRRSSRRPGKALLKQPGSSRQQRAVPGSMGQPQAQCGGRLPPPAARRAGAAPAPGTSGPAATPGQRAWHQADPSNWAAAPGSLGAAATTSQVSGGFRASRSASSEALGLVSLFQEDLERPGSESAGELCLPPNPPLAVRTAPHPALPHLTQNDPHWRVCLDGEA